MTELTDKVHLVVAPATEEQIRQTVAHVANHPPFTGDEMTQTSGDAPRDQPPAPKPAAPARKPPPKKKPVAKAAPAPEKVPGIVLRVAADLVVRYTPLGRGRWRIESEAAMQEVEVGGGIVGAHDGTYIEIGELHWNTWGHPEIMDPPVAPRIVTGGA